MTPAGAAGIPGYVGALEGHGAHRCAMTTRTSAKDAAGPLLGPAPPPRGAVATARRTRPATAAGRSQPFRRPALRRLNQWRTSAPMTNSTPRIAQPQGDPYVAG